MPPIDPRLGSRPFTRLERQILPMLLEGSSVKAIAAELEVSPGTASGHVRAICAKAGVVGAAEAALFVVQQPGVTKHGATYLRGLHAVEAGCSCLHCAARRLAA